MYQGWILAGFVLVIIVLFLFVWRSSHSSRRTKTHRTKTKCCQKNTVFGEFIRPFTFSPTGPGLPIVQPGASLVFPIPTVPPVRVEYVETGDVVGLLVPGGTYLVSWLLNPSEGSSVSLLVNGVDPTTDSSPSYFYGQALTTTVLNANYLITAPLPENNLLSLVNAGDTLLTLGNIPNTAIGSTSFLTQIRVQRLAPL